jgi:integrase
VVYDISYKDPASGRKVWEKVGKKSEGYGPEVSAELRGERIRTGRHEGHIQTQREILIESRKRDRILAEIADAYFNSEKGLKLKGRKTDMNRWENHIEAQLGKRRVSTLSELDVERIRRSMRGKAPATLWNTLELLRRLCNYGAKVGLCPPLGFVIEMPEKDNEVTEHLSPQEYKRLMAVLDEWKAEDVARMLKVAMFTGMRRGEVFKLMDTDIDWQKSLIRIMDPKGGKSVSVPLSDPVADILREQIAWKSEKGKDSLFLFPGRDGDQRKECTAVRRIKVKAELPKSFRIFHGLRHHFAVTLANSGEVDLSMIGELLTHKSAAMTSRYAHFLPETKQKAANLAAKLIQSNGEEDSSGNVVSLKREGV